MNHGGALVNVPPFCNIMFELHIFENYKEQYPKLKGSERTDIFIQRALKESGITEASVKRTEKGKPYLPENTAYISVSHSQDLIGICVADEEVGIDLQFSRGVNTQKIANRFFSRQEAEYLKSQENENAFFRLWTRKEAFAKLTDEGIGQLVKPISVLNRTDVEFEDFILEDGLYGCICTYR